MAVEIPVVVDIEGAFQEAARKIPKAISPLKTAIDGLNEDLAVFREMLNEVPVGSKDFQMIAKEIQNISQAMDIANAEFKRYSSNDGSIRQMSNELAFLNDQWEKMSKKDKFTATGELSDDAKRLYENYKNITSELERQGKTLAQLAADEKRTADDARRRAEEEARAREKIEALRNKGAKNRQYEAAILNATNKTMRTLQEQERILSSRLSQSIIGSSKYEKLKQQLEAVRKEIRAINGEPLRDVADGADKANSKLQNLLVNAVRLYALHAATRFVKNVREVTSEFELQRVALGSIIQDTERAEQLFKQIKAAAIESPFEIKDLVSYTKQLSAYQVETDKLFQTTMKLADVSAGLGVDMGRLILAYGQVRAASVLRGQELRQFTEAGIPLVEKLAEKFRELGREGTTTADVFQLISERAVPFRMIDEIFDDMTSAGGMFYKMQEKQAKTLAGQWANLKDALSIMYDEIGRTDAVHGAMEALIGNTRQLLLNWRKWADAIKVAGTSLIVYVGYQKALAASTALMVKIEAMATAAESTREKGMKRLITSIIGKTAAEKLSTKATHLASAATFKAAAATTALEKAFWRLTMALLNNPFGVAAIAITGLISLFTLLRKKTRDVEKDIESLKSSIISLDNTTGSVRKMIDDYEELSSKQKLNTEESKKLKDISLELAKAFPKATEKIDEQTGAFKLNIAKLRAYNEEAEKAIRRGTEAQIAVDEKELKRNQKKIEKLNKEINSGWGRDKAITLLSPLKIPLSESQIAERNAEVNELTQKTLELSAAIQEARDGLNGIKKDSGDAVKDVLKWQEKLIKFNSKLADDGTTVIQVLSPDQIKNMSNLDEALEEVAKSYLKQEERAQFLTKAIEGKNEEETKELKIALALAIARRDLAKNILDYYNAFSLTQKKTKTSSYRQDPFIVQMQNRMKFMQDFKKGYDDLRKYVGDSSALENELKTMMGRGMSLGLDASQQKRAASDLSKWYEDMIAEVSNKLRAKGVNGPSVTSLLGIDTTKRSKDVQDLQKLLQSLWDAKTDFDTSEMKKNFENTMKRLSDEIKRSETVRDFYNDILGITGDADIAASMSVSVYGGLGNDFKENLQKELNAALESLDAASRTDALNKAFAERDFDTILKNMDKFPEEWQKRLKEMAAEDQKFNAELAKNLLQTLERAKSYGQKRVEISQQTARRMQQIEDLNADEAIKAELRKQNAKKEAEDIAKLQYEAFKETPMYVELFSNLDRASTAMLRNMRDNIVKMKAQWTDLAPTEMKELQSRIAELDRQLATKNPFRELIAGIREYRALMQEQTRGEADTKAVRASEVANAQKQALEMADKMYNAIVKKYGVDSMEAKAAKKNLDVQKDKTDKAIEEEKAAQNTANSYRLAAKHISDAAEAMQEWAGYVSTSLGGIEEIVGTFASDDFAETFNIISGGINKTLSGTATLLAGISQGVFGIPQMIAGLGQIIGGIFGTAQQLKIKKADKEIDKQAKLINDLEYQYGRLENAIAKAFGSDYVTNYNQQLANLAAQQEAYLKQAEAERSKGKKADEEKIKDYENSARDAADKILDMQSQLSEFFSGTDITSAAKDFADSWLEAYKEFGSTTIAMRQKFQEMVEEMVQKSLAAKVMQELLTPIFNEIDRLAQEGGELSAQDIAAIAQMADQQIPAINDAMLTLMNTLSQAGYNLRQQPGQFTGIARNIANASEESITGLAAGINAQNYYLSYVPTLSANVAAILTAITGGTAAVEGTAPVTPTDGELMMSYLSTLPTMNENLAAILFAIKSVISPNNVATNTHYIAVRN